MERIKENLNDKNHININSYEIEFPFMPYECQIQIITTLLNTFDKKENCIIESPTGTGKCISALAACIAFMNRQLATKEFKEYEHIRQSHVDILEILEESLITFSKKNKKKNSDNEFSILGGENNLSKADLFVILSDASKMLDKKSLLKSGIINYYNSIESNDNDSIVELKKKITKAQDLILKNNKSLPKCHNIIYAVRTSSQIEVVFKELNLLPKMFLTCFLKSRDFHCINDKLKSNFTGNVLNLKCKELNKKEKCQYKALENCLPEYSLDFSIHKTQNICPYYSEALKSRRANLIVCTYNYLLSSKCRNLFSEYMVNPIVIIDEGHNILDACRDNINFEISIEDIYKTIVEIKQLREYQKNKLNKLEEFSIEEILKMENTVNHCSDMIGLLFLFLNNLLFMNQFEFITEIDYRGSLIFIVLYSLFNKNNFIEDEIKKLNIPQNFSTTYQEFFDLYINKYNENCFINEANYNIWKVKANIIYDENILSLNTEIKNIQKIMTFFELVLNNLTTNFVKNNNLKKTFIEDYYFIANGIGLKKKNFDKLNYYKQFILTEKINIEKCSDSKLFELYWSEFLKIYEIFKPKKIQLLSMNPKIAFRSFQKSFRPHSIVLLSGTISPVNFYETELGTEFKITLSTDHIICKSNINIMLFTNKIFNERSHNISFTQQLMKSDESCNFIFERTLKILLDFVKTGGVGNLIFLKSYEILKQFCKFILEVSKLNENGYTIEKINGDKIFKITCPGVDITLYFDCNNKTMKEYVLSEYKKNCANSQKSCLFSVMRGSFSEGVNFKNHECTSLFILGIPFPYLSDFVRLKRKHLTEKYKDENYSLNGEQWYELQAMNAINQSIGRSIRSINDYANICIIDDQIKNSSIKEKLSNWIKKFEMSFVEYSNYNLYTKKTEEFFQFHDRNFIKSNDIFH